MNKPGRVLFVVSLLGACLLPALLFPAFVQDNLVTPVALVLWLVWRLVQSIDQPVYWTLLVIVITGYLFLRLYRAFQQSPDTVPAAPLDINTAMERIGYWQLSIRVAGRVGHSAMLRHELGMMLATMYAVREPEAAQFEIYDALKRGEIPLPEPVYAFLFPRPAAPSRRSLIGILSWLRDLYQKQVRRWSGRETEAFHQSLDQVLAFMESILEHGYDDGRFTPSHH